MTEARSTVRRVIYGIAGVIIALLTIRFILLLLGANQSHFLVQFIYQLSGVLVAPFISTVSPFVLTTFTIDANTAIAIGVYIYLTFIFSEFILSFFDTDPVNVIVNVVDSMLKLLEFFLLSRFVLAFFGVLTNNSAFSATVFTLTGWSQGILPHIPFIWGIIELSTLLALVIVVVVDLSLENMVRNYREKRSKQTTTRTETVVRHQVPAAPAVQQHAPAQPQNITVNVSAPGIMTPPPPRHVVNVQPPVKHIAPPRDKVVRERKYV